MRDIKVTKNFINSKNTSVLYESGNTKVLITVSISDRVPGWLENSDKGGSQLNITCCQVLLIKEFLENHLKEEGLRKFQD